MKSNAKLNSKFPAVLFLSLFCVILLLNSCQRTGYNTFVNPFIGTGGHGHTFPGACYPFGMMQLSPDTRLEGWDGCSGYHYTDSLIYGFSHTHLSGTGVADYCDLLIMPGQGLIPEDIFSNSVYRSTFKKENEFASPAYYKVKLDKYSIWAEMTVGKRTGMHRYTYEDPKNQWLILDLKHRDPLVSSGITNLSSTGIEGFRQSSSWAKNQHFFFNIQFDKKIISSFFNADSTQMCLVFENNGSKILQLHVAISAVDANGASLNLEADWDQFNFEEMMRSSEDKWNELLSRIEIEDKGRTKKTIFYTALYHNLIHPSLFQDADGRFRGMDQNIYIAEIDDHFTVFSLWDTYRSTHPLYQFIYPDYNAKFIRTFLRQYQASRQLPVWELAGNETWCMIGNHAIPVIANAFAHNDFNFDTLLAKEAVKNSLMFGNNSGLKFMHKGFIASNEESESVSKTIENSLDFAAAEFIRADVDRSLSPYGYRNLFCPKTGFFQAKLNQKFIADFDPREVNFHFTEANAYQYLFGAHHDVSGMMNLMGGSHVMHKKLDEVFTSESKMTGRVQSDITGLIGQYAHGNEPSHHYAYLYNYVGAPEKAQRYVSAIKEQFYKNSPDGLIGNEDCGQMSSWYVFSALGFYPVHPFHATYDLGVPSFRHATIKVPGKKPIQIQSNISAKNKYVSVFKKNGSFPGYRFSLSEGDVLEFSLAKRALNEKLAEFPSEEPLYRIAPYILKGDQVFKDSNRIELASVQNLDMVYSFDTTRGPVYDYKQPIVIYKPTTLYFKLKQEESGRSWQKADFFVKPNGIKLTLTSTYANQYAATGPDALIDGVHGSEDYRDGFWQGFQAQDLVAELEFDEVQNSGNIQIRFLQDQKSWILLPSEVSIEYSLDGKSYSVPFVAKTEIPLDTEHSLTKTYNFNPGQSIRFARIKAKNAGQMPSWHLGAGGDSWLFCDEIKWVK
ncbi:MAG: GH92 family glycosyl hydrolase [Saprospiraceae bacterium]|nr:GH92 family glycosyl hydrolase [Saprospiraceae bacterium]